LKSAEKRFEDYFKYCGNGGLVRLKKVGGPTFVGQRTIGFNRSKNRQYKQIKFFGKYFYIHRVIWLVVKRTEPPRIIDHINGNGADNRIENLRAANHAENNYNSKLRKDNKTGFRGITKRGNSFRVRLMKNGKEICFGSFKTKKEAIAIQRQALEQLHLQFKRKNERQDK